jgi:protein-S-isoprenylcysteine O-methyltransferase Ste14
MDPHLKTKALASLGVLPTVFAALLFPPAGTLHYWQAWLFLGVFWAATTLSTLSLIKNDPALLERRMKSGPTAEKRGAQKLIMWCASVLFVAMVIVSGLDHRLGWSHMSVAWALVGNCMIAIGFVVVHLVFKENSFASATIEISDGQKVISTGPYSLVRHPMYSGALVLLLGIPLALGSLWAVVVFAPLLPVLIWRIIDEEKLLNNELAGYTEYCTRVRHRLVPWLY